MDTDQGISLLSNGDQLEQGTWATLEPYLSKMGICLTQVSTTGCGATSTMQLFA
jgi:hypothetical protein